MNSSVTYQKPYPRLDPNRMVGRDGKKFSADEDLLATVNVALALDRPLLLTGEPGCGKTDFAFAAASGGSPGGRGRSPNADSIRTTRGSAPGGACARPGACSG